jgi:hypothetical protein
VSEAARGYQNFAVDPQGRLDKGRVAFRSAASLTIVYCLFGISAVKSRAIVSAVQYSSGALQAQQQITAQSKADEATRSLLERVGKPDQGEIEAFKNAGMQDVTPHILTAEERVAVEAALASLPALNKRVLEHHLHRLAFVDGIPGEGTGLTSPNPKTGQSNITLRASVINESLTTFLTNKEGLVYKQDGSGMTISVAGTGTNALRYVLLHESTHVVDVGCHITSDPYSRFTRDIWTGPSTLTPSLAAITPRTHFRGSDRLSVVKAPELYDALSQTPFVSLYATTSRQEDLAELVAWHEVYTRDGGDLILRLKDAKGKTVEEWHPLKFPKVQKRFVEVEKLLESQPQCGNPM